MNLLNVYNNISNGGEKQTGDFQTGDSIRRNDTDNKFSILGGVIKKAETEEVAVNVNANVSTSSSNGM